MSLQIPDIMANVSWLNITKGDEAAPVEQPTLSADDQINAESFEFALLETTELEDEFESIALEVSEIPLPKPTLKTISISVSADIVQQNHMAGNDWPSPVREVLSTANSEEMLAPPLESPQKILPIVGDNPATKATYHVIDTLLSAPPNKLSLPILTNQVTSVILPSVVPTIDVTNKGPQTVVESVAPPVPAPKSIDISTAGITQSDFSQREILPIARTQITPPVTKQSPILETQLATADPSMKSIPITHAKLQPLGATVDLNHALQFLEPFTHTSKLVAYQIDNPEKPRNITTLSQQILPKISAVVSGKHSESIEIRLDPQELGKLSVTITKTEIGSIASILVEKIEVFDFLRRNSDVLAAELKKAGLENNTLQFSHRDRSETNQRKSENWGSDADFVDNSSPSDIATIPHSQNTLTKLDIRL